MNKGTNAMRDLTRGGFLRLVAATAAGLSSARAEELQTLKVGGIQLTTNAPLYIGMARGTYAQQGLKLELVWFTAASNVFTAVVSRDIDVGVTSMTAATFNLAAKGGFKIIAGSTRDAPHFRLNAVVVSNKAYDSGFTSFAAMGGRRFGITTAGSSLQYYWGQLAKKYGAPMSSIVLVPLESYANLVAALSTNQIDAAILPPAQTQRLIDTKSAHFLAWTGDEVPQHQGVVFASPRTLADKPDAVRRFLRAYVQGTREYNLTFNQLDAQNNILKGPQSAELIDIIARGAGIKPSETEGQLAYIVADARPDQADIANQIAFWQEQGVVSKTADFSGLYDLSFLPA